MTRFPVHRLEQSCHVSVLVVHYCTAAAADNSSLLYIHKDILQQKLIGHIAASMQTRVHVYQCAAEANGEDAVCLSKVVVWTLKESTRRVRMPSGNGLIPASKYICFIPTQNCHNV